MKFNVVTIMPKIVEAALEMGVVGQAIARKEIGLEIVNPRSFTKDVHHTVDDRPFGGGDGMVMKCEPLISAIESLGSSAGHRVLLSAQGKTWGDKMAREWAEKKTNITLVCGRYGGVDQRFINKYIDEEVSIGDFILSGGELAALVLIDTTARFLPNILGNNISKDDDSFSNGLLEAPLFTRPQNLGDIKIPRVFLCGDHEKIKMAKRLLSLLTTLEKRPDLFLKAHEIELKNASPMLGQFTFDELVSCGLTKPFVQKFYAPKEGL
jgi:tRNA (guanine37-N1)-methyltransferase